MSPAHVLEPTYRRLKRALMEGIWPGGAKLEAMRLAEDFGVSMTPVRDSLNQLVGEGLVDLTPGEGFRVPPLTEQRLRDLLDVNAVLLETANKSNWRLPAEHRTEASTVITRCFVFCYKRISTISSTDLISGSKICKQRQLTNTNLGREQMLVPDRQLDLQEHWQSG